jgi:GntR family transcriptional regulator/MocR family aminotransferase
MPDQSLSIQTQAEATSALDIPKTKRVNKIGDQRDEGLWNRLLDIPDPGNSSLQKALSRNLAKAILDGRIPEGARLPSTRLLASMLRVARITVGLAYDGLAEQGLIVAKPKRGHFVAEGLRRELKTVGIDAEYPPLGPVWSRYLKPLTKGEKWLESSRPFQEFPYSFASGKVDNDLLPPDDWHECLAQATAERDHWTANTGDGDDPFLIEQICSRVLPRRGITALPDEVLITMGTQMGLYLLSELTVSAGAVVAIEEPGYMGARNVFLRRGATLAPVPVDTGGAIPPNGMANCSLIYVTPGHHTPTGVVMSQERRHAFLSLAHGTQSLIIEDDYEAEMGFGADPVPALKAIDRFGYVIYLSSFSNSVAPGMRVGFITGDRKLIDRARKLRRVITRHTPGNNQRALALFIAQGHYERSLSRQRELLESRARQLAQSLQKQLPDWSFHLPAGGSNLWVQVPADIDTGKLELKARENGVLIERGDSFYHSAVLPHHFVRLTYSSISLDKIDAGIQLLARATNELAADWH